MPSNYPGSLDNFPTVDGNRALGANPKHSVLHTNVHDAIVAMQKHIGTLDATLPGSLTSNLKSIKTDVSTRMPRSGGAFTGRIEVPDAAAGVHAPNWKQVQDHVTARVSERALQPPDENTPGGWGRGKYAVVSRGSVSNPNVISLFWSSGARVVRIGVDVTNMGNLMLEPPSLAAAKNSLRKASEARTMPDAPDYEGFFDAVDVYDFDYLPYDEYENNGTFAGTSHIGWVADFVESALEANNMPDGVITRDPEGNVEGISDRDMCAVLWQVVKDLKARVDVLESKP